MSNPPLEAIMELRNLAALAATCCLALSTMTACTTSHLAGGDPERPYPPSQPLEVGTILHIPTGIVVSEEEMLAAVTDMRIVYVGETHDNPASHRVQLTVLEAMAERWPGVVSLGMEMFTAAQQPALDRWVAGELGEKEFLKEVDWHANWSMDFALYRDLLLLARDRKIPVIGLNADKALVKAVGRKEPADLTEEERARLPEMDMTDPYQTALVEAIYGGHASGEGRLAGFQRVQTLWDETMAENVANYLLACPDGTRRMVVLAGGNHIRYGFGIPRRVFRRLPTSYALVGSHEVTVPMDKQDRLMDVDIPGFPMPAYDYLVCTAYESLPADKVRLGVRLEEQEGKVVVQAVVPGSTAEQGGVLVGDVIVALDGEAISDNFDLIYAIGQKVKGDKGLLDVERAGARLTLAIEFQPLPESGAHKP
jgi:uncharacterized iron-regulated protein